MSDLPSLCLAVRQPWAWAIIHGGKNIENRTQFAVTSGKMRPGRIAILASRGMLQAEYAGAREFMAKLRVQCPAPADLVRGAIIGSVTVDRIVGQSSSPWWMGAPQRCLVLANPEACDPIPCAGQLGYFEWRPRQGGEVEKPAKWMLPKALPTAPPLAELFDVGD